VKAFDVCIGVLSHWYEMNCGVDSFQRNVLDEILIQEHTTEKGNRFLDRKSIPQKGKKARYGGRDRFSSQHDGV